MIKLQKNTISFDQGWPFHENNPYITILYYRSCWQEAGCTFSRKTCSPASARGARLQQATQPAPATWTKYISSHESLLDLCTGCNKKQKDTHHRQLGRRHCGWQCTSLFFVNTSNWEKVTRPTMTLDQEVTNGNRFSRQRVRPAQSHIEMPCYWCCSCLLTPPSPHRIIISAYRRPAPALLTGLVGLRPQSHNWRI